MKVQGSAWLILRRTACGGNGIWRDPRTRVMLLRMPSPSWLLLVWSGCAATFAAAVFATAIGGGRAHAWSLAPRPRSTSGAFGWNAVAGIALYPLLYGIAFELAGTSDVRSGLLAGFIHAAAMFAAARPRHDIHGATRVAAAHLVYAVVLAFLYVTP
jgi:hypothetical protein